MLFGTKCPCNSGEAYKNCCKPFLEEETLPETAVQLVRSRYTAFKYQNIDYIYRTVHPKKRKKVPKEMIEQMATHIEWKDFELKSIEGGEKKDVQGTVEFVAQLKAPGGKQEYHEFAECRRLGEKWFYVDGRVIHPIQAAKKAQTVGRNDPCPCGSGKKYKKCCG